MSDFFFGLVWHYLWRIYCNVPQNFQLKKKLLGALNLLYSVIPHMFTLKTLRSEYDVNLSTNEKGDYLFHELVLIIITQNMC